MSRIASLGDLPACRIASTCSVIGISIRCSRASASNGAAVFTPSATMRIFSRISFKGRPLNEILENMRMVAEGVNTAAPLLALAREHRIEMPITEQVDAILHAGKSPKDAIRDIMERPLKRE